VIGLGLSEGIALETILDSLRKHRGIRGRLELVEAGQKFDLYIDYAHTPDGLENVLGTLRELSDRRLIVVFGCGGDRDRSKRPLMGRAAVRLADEVIITSDNPRREDPASIINDILSRLPRRGRKVRVLADRRQAIEAACRLASPGDIVLIAGKGHEQNQIFRDRVIPFSDREVAEEVLSRITGRVAVSGDEDRNGIL
jgi:UDP-N-acetylmuramoyl-L-alanyl-D-glutamate--2,6-diaminopimelate ligase